MGNKMAIIEISLTKEAPSFPSANVDLFYDQKNVECDLQIYLQESGSIFTTTRHKIHVL